MRHNTMSGIISGRHEAEKSEAVWKEGIDKEAALQVNLEVLRRLTQYADLLSIPDEEREAIVEAAGALREDGRYDNDSAVSNLLRMADGLESNK